MPRGFPAFSARAFFSAFSSPSAAGASAFAAFSAFSALTSLLFPDTSFFALSRSDSFFSAAAFWATFFSACRCAKS